MDDLESVMKRLHALEEANRIKRDNPGWRGKDKIILSKTDALTRSLLHPSVDFMDGKQVVADRLTELSFLIIQTVAQLEGR